MNPVELSHDELKLVHNALEAFLSDFSHKEKEIVHQLKELLVKIPDPEGQRA